MSYIEEQFSSITFDDVNPGKDRWKALKVFLYWTIPAFSFVLIVDFIGNYRSVISYQKAIFQGIGPILWNVIGTFGLAFFWLSITFSKSKFIALTAYKLLDNVFAIGSLSLGLL